MWMPCELLGFGVQGLDVGSLLLKGDNQLSDLLVGYIVCTAAFIE